MLNTDHATLEREVREAISRQARLAVPVAELSSGASLYAVGLSSHATVHVMLDLEEAFDVEFPDELITKDTFATIENLIAALLRAQVG